jgi:hypothetical protein
VRRVQSTYIGAPDEELLVSYPFLLDLLERLGRTFGGLRVPIGLIGALGADFWRPTRPNRTYWSAWGELLEAYASQSDLLERLGRTFGGLRVPIGLIGVLGADFWRRTRPNGTYWSAWGELLEAYASQSYLLERLGRTFGGLRVPIGLIGALGETTLGLAVS